MPFAKTTTAWGGPRVNARMHKGQHIAGGITFELAHAAKHVSEIDHLEQAHAPAQ
jgi:hypothetical protein